MWRFWVWHDMITRFWYFRLELVKTCNMLKHWTKISVSLSSSHELLESYVCLWCSLDFPGEVLDILPWNFATESRKTWKNRRIPWFPGPQPLLSTGPSWLGPPARLLHIEARLSVPISTSAKKRKLRKKNLSEAAAVGFDPSSEPSKVHATKWTKGPLYRFF